MFSAFLYRPWLLLFVLSVIVPNFKFSVSDADNVHKAVGVSLFQDNKHKQLC